MLNYALSHTMKYDSLPLSKRFSADSTTKAKLSLKNLHDHIDAQGNGVDFVDPDTGYTPLIVATIQGKLEVIKVFMERGAHIDYQETHKQRTAMILAAKHGQSSCLEELLKRGAMVNAVDKYQMTALMYASREGHADCVYILLNRMAGINNTDESGYTAAHYASKFGHSKVVELLYDRGASLEIRDNKEGMTPLHLASQYGRRETVSVLLERSAKVNRRTTLDKHTAAMLASKEGHKSTVSLLIAKGADVNLVDRFGWTPLHYAASWGRRDTALILLVEGNADVNSCETTSEAEGGTPPLVVAAKGSQVSLVELLLDFGADINCPERVHGHSALSAAAELGLTEVVKLLIDYHADINYKSVVGGMTALMLAAANGRHGCITLLLDYYADINILDDRSWNALMHATKSGHRDVLLSAMVHTTAAAKVNLIPWIEMECPHMQRDSLCGSPAVFLDRILYSAQGIYNGLLGLTGDRDVYLVYCLVMLASSCKRAMEVHPYDKVSLQRMLDEMERMLCACITSRSMAIDSVFTDTFLIGHKPCSSLGPFDIKYLTSCFLSGPLALCLDAGLTSMIDLPQMRDKIDRCFWSCLKDNNLWVPSLCNRIRYCPAYMFIMEGLSKALLLVVVTWHSSIVAHSDVFTDSSTTSSSLSSSSSTTSTSPSSSSSSSALVIVLFLAHLLYELGLMEEKRWMVSPSVVFKIKDLETRRKQVASQHFLSDVWRFTDLMALLFMLLWLVLRIADSNASAISERLLVLSTIPLSLGLLRYPAAFHAVFGQQVLAIFLITKSLSAFLMVYLASGLGVGIVLYAVFRDSLHSFHSPVQTFLTLFDTVLTNGTINLFEGTGNMQIGTAVLVIFLVWSVFVLGNAMAGFVCATYATHLVDAGRLWVLIHARHVQQFCVSLEKSPLCMLPPPFNLITSIIYPHHAFYIWRAKLYSKRMFCVSFAGTVSDKLLALIVLLPMSAYEYALMVGRWDVGVGNKVLLMLAMPVGCLYYAATFLMTIITEPAVRLIVKSRLSDGRLRVSYGTSRDSIENDSLANFMDEKLFKFLELFRDRGAKNEADIYQALLPTIYGSNDDGYNDDDATVATVDARTLVLSPNEDPRTQSQRYKGTTMDLKVDEDDQSAVVIARSGSGSSKIPGLGKSHRTKSTDREDDSVSRLTFASSQGISAKGSLSKKSRMDIWKSMKKVGIGALRWDRTSPYKGKQVRITPGSPFLHLSRVHSLEEVQDALPSSSQSKRLPPRYEQSLVQLPLSAQQEKRAHQEAHERGRREGSMANKTSEERDRAPILFLDDGSISPYQAGFSDLQILEHFTMSVDADYEPDRDDGVEDDHALAVHADGRGGGNSVGGVDQLKPTSPTMSRRGDKLMFINNYGVQDDVPSDLDDYDDKYRGGGNNAHTIAASSDPLVAYKEERDLVALEYDSLYFARHRYLPIYSEQDKRRIFAQVLPELFPSEHDAALSRMESMHAQIQQDNKMMLTRLQMHSILLQRIVSTKMMKNQTKSNISHKDAQNK